MRKNEKEELQKAWVESAEDDLKTAEGLFKLERLSGALFFCHLAIEKVLKALFVKANETYPPPTHKLVRLARLAKIDLDKQKEEHLEEITTFNIEARYDVFKEKLYKKATKEFTKKYLKISKELIEKFKSLI